LVTPVIVEMISPKIYDYELIHGMKSREPPMQSLVRQTHTQQNHPGIVKRPSIKRKSRQI